MRILILYPGLLEERCQIVAAHRLRLKLSRTRLILADETLQAQDAEVFDDVLKLPSSRFAEEAWYLLAKYLRRHPVDGIVAQSEAGLLLGARAAREFDLPGPSVESVLATVNKHATRLQLAEAGIAQPAFALVGEREGVRRFADQHGWPVVLKACASSRQRLVTLVSSAAELEGAVARMQQALPQARDVLRLQSFAKLEGVELSMDPSREFLVEAFQPGMPIECDALLSGATPRWFGVIEQLPSPERSFFIEGYLLPARLSAALQGSVLQLAAQALETIGLRDTGTSVELRLAEDGPRIIEINGRLPWDEGLQELVQAATGVVPSLCALKLAMGRRLPRPKQRCHAALLYRANYEAGEVIRIPDPEEWRRQTRGAAGAWLLAGERDQLLEGEHPDSRPHVAALLTTDRRSSALAMEQGRALLQGLEIEIRPQPRSHPGALGAESEAGPDSVGTELLSRP